MFIDHDQPIYVVDTHNYRILEWKMNAINGQIITGRDDQLNCPRKVIVDQQNDSLIICDFSNRRVVQ